MQEPRRVALHAWVPTAQKGQDHLTQFRQHRAYKEARGCQITAAYMDYGAGTTEEPGQYKIMLDAAGMRNFAVVLVWRYLTGSLISQRLKADMSRAKAQGKHVAWPPLPEALQKRVVELHKQGLSINKISQRLGIVYGREYNYAPAFKL